MQSSGQLTSIPMPMHVPVPVPVCATSMPLTTLRQAPVHRCSALSILLE